jgi:hypothetical protein
MNVNEHIVRQDLDGQLVRISQGQTASYAKRLSLHTAWHAADLHDLEALSPIVQGVEQDLDRNVLTVRYNQLLVPLDETRLRQMLRVDGALAGWRLARLASDLCK